MFDISTKEASARTGISLTELIAKYPSGRVPLAQLRGERASASSDIMILRVGTL